MEAPSDAYLSAEQKDRMRKAGWVQDAEHDWTSPNGQRWVDTYDGLMTIQGWHVWANTKIAEAEAEALGISLEEYLGGDVVDFTTTDETAVE